MRKKIFYKIAFLFIDKGSMLPWYLIILRFFLLPLETLYYMLDKKHGLYDMQSDTYTIEGMRYSGEYFRSLAKGGIEPNVVFRIIKRDDDCVTIEQLNESKKHDV
jgi:hypothetical protein